MVLPKQGIKIRVDQKTALLIEEKKCFTVLYIYIYIYKRETEYWNSLKIIKKRATKTISALSGRAKSKNSEKVFCVNIGVYILTQFKSHKKHDLTNFSLSTWKNLVKLFFWRVPYLNRTTSDKPDNSIRPFCWLLKWDHGSKLFVALEIYTCCIYGILGIYIHLEI